MRTKFGHLVSKSNTIVLSRAKAWEELPHTTAGPDKAIGGQIGWIESSELTLVFVFKRSVTAL